MKTRSIILFDLDGTLTDPKVGITRSVAYALSTFGITVEDTDSLTPFIGPPLHESFMKYYGFDAEQAWEAVLRYRVYFDKTGIFENRLYEGVPEMLSALQQAGKTLLLATSKPLVSANIILEHFNIAQYFTAVSGSELDGRRIHKEEVIRYAFELCQADEQARRQAVMVGDRMHDVVGARKVGIPCIGVLYGYGSREELKQAGAECIVETVNDLRNLLL